MTFFWNEPDTEAFELLLAPWPDWNQGPKLTSKENNCMRAEIRHSPRH